MFCLLTSGKLSCQLGEGDGIESRLTLLAFTIKCLPSCTKDYSCQLKVLMFDHNFIFVVDLTETFNFTHSETMHEIDHEEVFIIAKPICQQMDNRSKKTRRLVN